MSLKYLAQTRNALAFVFGMGPTTGPMKVQWDLLFACNSRCVMCDRWDKTKYPDEDLLPRERILEVVDEMARMGVLSVSLSGGEVFLQPDILDLVRAIKKRGINVLINSNGLLVTEKKAREIAESGVNEIIFSVDSAKDELHDKIRGIPGNLKRVLKAIRDCVAARDSVKNHRLKISANATLCDWNCEEMGDILRMVKEAGVDSMTISPVHKIEGMGFNTREEMALTPSGVEKFSAAFKKLPIDLRNLMPFQDDYFLNFETLVKNQNALLDYRCPAGHLTLQLHPNGDVHACIVAFKKLGSLKEQSLREIWNSPLARQVRKEIREGRHPVCWYSCIAPVAVLMDDVRHVRLGHLLSRRTLRHVFSRMRP